jgi:exo-beta-1,3-glucanase (GH17 family)
MNKWIYLLLIGILTLPGVSLAGTITEQFHGVSYGPFHMEGQSPDLYTEIPSDQIRADLGMISRAHFIHVRTFALDNNLDQVPGISETYYPKLKIWLGVYESNVNHDDPDDPHATLWQLDRAVELANSYDNVVGIVVGDECLNGDARAGDHWVSAAQLLADLDYVDEGLVALGIRNRETSQPALGSLL